MYGYGSMYRCSYNRHALSGTTKYENEIAFNGIL